MDRNRVIRTATRPSEGNYKIDCEGIKANEVLSITITHESKSEFLQKYEVPGSKLLGKRSISFKAIQTEDSYRISWVGSVLPKRILQ